MLKADYTSWIGRSETATSRLAVETAEMLRATVMPGRDRPFAEGDLMPALWHWSAFLPFVQMARLTEDGHPQRGGLLPPVPLRRRMWAGGDVAFHAPMRVGAELSRTSTIADVAEKTGAAGPMVFVTVNHEIICDGALAVSERQDIVFLDIPDAYRPPKVVPPLEDPDFDIGFAVNEPLLFRYSAATFNAHRIHYDLPYATQVEHYPGLVVHAPLQATLLLATAIDQTGRDPATYTYRGVHPMFHFHDLRLMGRQTDTGDTRVCTATDTHQGLSGTVRWRPQS